MMRDGPGSGTSSRRAGPARSEEAPAGPDARQRGGTRPGAGAGSGWDGDGDGAEFDAFFEATSPRLVGQVFAMTGDLGEAEDALQEAYIRAWQRWPRLREYENPEAWVRSVAFRLCVNAWWKAKNRLTAHRHAVRHEYVPELGPDLVTLVQALRMLPEKHRRALVLHYVADLSVDQIAAETGAAPGTVKSWLSRGRRALGPLVSEFCDDGPARAAAGDGPRAAPAGVGGAPALINRFDHRNPSSSKDYGYA